MKKNLRKSLKEEFAKKNIKKYFSLLEKRFYPSFDSIYIKEILKFSKAFNIRLSREEKQKFCKKCHSYFSVETREIRLNAKNCSKEIICKNCGYTRKYKYK